MAIFTDPAFHEHERVLFCHDRSTGLRAIIALHDTRLGPGLGGVRLREYSGEAAALTDVLRLSRAMTYKAAVAGLDLGGGKAVMLGPIDETRRVAVFRAMGRFVDSLGGRYIATEDMNTATADMETLHESTRHVVGREAGVGGAGDPSPVTARGVYLGIRAALRAAGLGEEPAGRHVAIEGVGKVGLALAQSLMADGAKVTVCDTRQGQLDAARRLGAQVAPYETIHHTRCDVFAPCATGASINGESIPRLRCRIVAGAANNQLDTPADGEALHRRGILYAPDFVINAGGLINVADELSAGGYKLERVMQRVVHISSTLAQIFAEAARKNRPTGPVALALAQRRIESPSNQS